MEIELVILLILWVVGLVLWSVVYYRSVPETSVSDKQRDILLRKFSTSERKNTNLSRLKDAHTVASNNGTLRKVSKSTVEDTKALVLFEECFAKAMTKNKIEQSGRTHIANYTKYRYTGSSSRDVEIYHQPTQQWVLYYLMFSTPFEDSSLKCNGVDVTGSCNSAETPSVSRSDVFASPEYDDSTTRNNRYSDDYSSSSNSDYSSSSYSSSDSGSSSSYSSSSD